MPKMITASSPLPRERLMEIRRQSRMPLWPVSLSGGVLLGFFSLFAILYASEQSIPGGIGTAIFCLTACVAFLILMILVSFRRQSEDRQWLYYAACGEQTGVIEVYCDRVVKITPYTRTTVYLRGEKTTIWETPQMIAVGDGNACVVWQSQDLTVLALEHLRQLIYPAVPPHQRKSSGRTMALACALAPLPEIRFSGDILCRLQYQPDMRRQVNRQTGRLVVRMLPFNAVGAGVGGALLCALFPLPLPRPLHIFLLGLALLFVMQGLTTGVIRYHLRAQRHTVRRVGVAFTADGMALEENGCLRFLPRACVKSQIKKESLMLQTPVGTFCIPWEDIPDPDLVKRLLMLGD